MKQKKISRWLVAVCILIAIMGAVVFAGIAVFKYIGYVYNNDTYMILSAVFGAVLVVLCYMILFQFYKVSRQIGEDNSFSMENALSFHRMSIYAAIIACTYVIRMVAYLIMNGFYVYAFGFHIIMLFISIIVCVLCEALSKLIANAYEVKQENEYTI